MVTYRGNWRGIQDWLGYQPRKMLPFGMARMQARLLGLRSRLEWNAWAKSDRRPRNIPSNPWKVYVAHWRGLRDWLGVIEHRHWRDLRLLEPVTGLRATRAWRWPAPRRRASPARRAPGPTPS
jgi:hypothetical protein